MTDGMELWGELLAAVEDCDARIGEMRESGRMLAAKERDYRVAKAERIMVERKERGTPVSIIADVVKGAEDISRMAFERDCAEVEYRADYEALLVAKKRLGVIERQYEREWVGK